MKLLAIPAIVMTLALSACTGTSPNPAADSPSNASANAGKDIPALDAAGWTTTTYQNLTGTISKSAGQGKIVVFDFDNTTQARDISEAMLAEVQKTNAIEAASLSPALYPPFSTADGTKMSISTGVFDYYEALLDSGGEADPFREYSSLPMPSSVFYGRTVADFLATTSAVYNGGSALDDLTTGKQSKILGAARPFIYPQMADL